MNSLPLAVSDQIGGELPVKTECLPFSQIPHTTRLFSDFLSYAGDVRRFYPRSPHFAEWLKQETANIRYERFRRQLVAEILKRLNQQWGASPKTFEMRPTAGSAVSGSQRQNQQWGASPKTFENIARFRTGALAAV